MYCKYCGAEIADKAVICVKCGCQQEKLQGIQSPDPTIQLKDDGNIGWAFLGFFLPVVGLILFLTWNDTKPKTAKVVGKGALVSLIVQIVCGILLGIYSASLIGALVAEYS